MPGCADLLRAGDNDFRIVTSVGVRLRIAIGWVKHLKNSRCGVICWVANAVHAGHDARGQFDLIQIVPVECQMTFLLEFAGERSIGSLWHDSSNVVRSQRYTSPCSQVQVTILTPAYSSLS